MKKVYHFAGVDGFSIVQAEVWKMLDGNGRFLVALGEALCNALRYGRGGMDIAKVGLTLKVSNRHIIAEVISDNEGFDVNHRLANLPVAPDRKGRSLGLGIGLMLKACDKVVFNSSGNKVILAAKKEAV